MIVTHKLNIDLTSCIDLPQRIDVVQGDANTRAVEITLSANGEAYEIPEYAAAVVRYRKTDGTGGAYDTMPDGTPAYSVSGSTVTVLLAPQMLTCRGMAWVSVALTSGSKVLGIFTFTLYIQGDPSIGAAESADYFSYDTMEKINTAIAGALAGVESIDEQIADALADMTQLDAHFVNSIDECTDTNQVYILPDGYIYAYLRTPGDKNYVNYLLLATDTEGNPYNGGQGWQADTRLNSSGGEAAAAGTETTGFIPLAVGDVLRFENMKIAGTDETNTTQYIVFYDSDHAKLKHIYTHHLYATSNQATHLTLDDNGYWVSYDTSNLKALDGAVDWSTLAYFRLSAEEITADSCIIINEETTEGEVSYGWNSTGHAFVPADYEDRILALEETAEDFAEVGTRLQSLEEGYDSVVLPSHWQTHCEEKAALIRTAMENAGRDKSAFLWYTDTHWAYGSRMAPRLLKYLCRNTAMNKTNFGGDIVDDYGVSAEECMDGLRQWRLAVRDLPNHHSVLGNHDDDIAELSTANRRYGFLMAAEEDPRIVRGGDFYYYIDDPNEKTRYLYLDTSGCVTLEAAGDPAVVQFAMDALAQTPAGWHVVAISHIWFLYADTSTPTVGDVPDYCRLFLDLFDACNAGTAGTLAMCDTTFSYDFTQAGCKVEFCIGGHTHVDYDFTSDGGIPVILTETDSFHLRSGLSGAAGTVNEASVSGIIADYGNGRISVIRIGRGEDREIAL